MSREPEDTAGTVDTESAPQLRVLTPDATPEQIAAVVAVFSAMGSGEEDPPTPRSEWASPARAMRQPLHPGPGGWRASALPR